MIQKLTYLFQRLLFGGIEKPGVLVDFTACPKFVHRQSKNKPHHNVLFENFIFAIKQNAAKRAVFQKLLFLCGFFLIAGATSLSAQNVSLTTGISPYQHLTNPSNLYVQDRLYNVRVSALQSGYLSYTPQPGGSIPAHVNRLFDTKYWRNTGRESEFLTPGGREQIIRDHYGSGNSARFFNQAEMNWLDIRWHGSGRSYALSLKTRYASRFEIGRGIFSMEGAGPANGNRVNRSFHQKSHVLHEISFTTAEPLTYLSGMLPNLSQFVVGISPKLLIAGGYTELQADEQVHFDSLTNTWSSDLSFHQKAAGYMAQFATDAMRGGYVPGLTRKNLLNPAGYGVGIDAGISYMMTLGDDLSLLNRGREATRKALRVNFSLTDIGAMIYSGDTFEATLDPDVTTLHEEPAVAERTFYGAPAEYIYFLEPLGLHEVDRIQIVENESMAVFLPSAAHFGLDFRYNRFSAEGSAHYYFQDHAFSASGFGVNSVLEIRPVSLLSFHAGAGFSQNQPSYYSGGARLHTRWFEVNASAVLIQTAGSNTHTFSGAMGGIAFFLN